jgi:enoyl-CoA hydratase/carnithine racemase
VLACDLRFAARESAIFGRPEAALGLLPGGGAAQHLTRLMGRGPSARGHAGQRGPRRGAGRTVRLDQPRAARPRARRVRQLARASDRGDPGRGRVAVKDRVNAIALAPADDFRRDSDLFGEGVRDPEAQSRIGAAMQRGFQTREAEMDLARMLGDLAAG